MEPPQAASQRVFPHVAADRGSEQTPGSRGGRGGPLMNLQLY